MVSKVLFWSGFGVAVRLWQLGMEMRPFFNKGSLWAYPLYATIGGSFGYWLQGVETRQYKLLADRKDALLEKRARRQAQEKNEGLATA
ncbi:NADH:ubiquinone oxidoreductase kD subunit [Neofusicoccum parvum]|uniref:NADH-ubiquinone oxidoreductase 14 kDa subunit n=3 Tax=Neofusicoccum TaxID=407951 RepID=A0ABR3SYP5_9PEZI|nr:putative nadh-ubiquinone oxidoreductase 14 kda subunit protein [Neofusicoccum parvum UCRNP2]GME26736.1 NADH:ubiquinone oxidoreductase kD subunit [Neofusicoccum parvum]GME43984.1 NADH:ubiquinone oxidoreductase kD subunit [Neofusicoccum parvum]